MQPIDFKGSNIKFAVGQPQYLVLPAYRSNDINGTVTTCWKLTWKEKLKILWTGKLWLQQMAFKQALQPQRPTVWESEL